MLSDFDHPDDTKESTAAEQQSVAKTNDLDAAVAAMKTKMERLTRDTSRVNWVKQGRLEVIQEMRAASTLVFRIFFVALSRYLSSIPLVQYLQIWLEEFEADPDVLYQVLLFLLPASLPEEQLTQLKLAQTVRDIETSHPIKVVRHAAEFVLMQWRLLHRFKMLPATMADAHWRDDSEIDPNSIAGGLLKMLGPEKVSRFGTSLRYEVPK
ncbi:hypothetical protein HK102_000017 [Quaeritorhiza haematococci]|nr:hypothetical protein HK102_000017 [Quaeritorhiza haematococci]